MEQERGYGLVGDLVLGLLEEIENCRDEMVRLASGASLLNQQVIEMSIKLDLLLNEYHSFITKR
ncbi:aspartyl-phosphate phosphatase Spo0E family protein [Neobacillus soli]|uniref:aspartyl-phosphate phosphatase Spo0E family protein n=1 Tax=Neobacillus soli TaxID=220688 RepID=UPI000826080D|nr:aspartyl-phosphate phosphatase Spo0E family protein [Neobacillus soli]